MSQYSITPPNAINVIAEVKVPSNATAWEEMGGITSASTSGGEAPTSEVSYMGGPTIQLTGRPGGVSVSVAVSAFQPHSDLAKRLKAAHTSVRPRTKIGFRLRALEEDLYTTTTGTAAVATSGVVTFGGAENPTSLVASEEIGVGAVLKIGSGRYVIQSISDTNEVVVDAPDAEVTAASYSIVVPDLRLTLPSCSVMDYGNPEIGADGTFTTTLGLSIRGQLPEWTIG